MSTPPPPSVPSPPSPASPLSLQTQTLSLLRIHITSLRTSLPPTIPLHDYPKILKNLTNTFTALDSENDDSVEVQVTTSKKNQPPPAPKVS
ncbi:hypothetical protein TL16_g06667 [Triparma laevis f. inornata]|uniref:Uncharacterized protein n=2 Tax=Triparma laevis TaxID=1534972 RepID=A0A9W7FCV4_9STRA|nr:hypothetical protein TL16_g06667 [Triparma laevis f. inornata]GMI09850.1 hypothetical protein TrLO_g15267 [Triparma laevis f. longispina]